MMLAGELGVGEATEALANLERFAQMRGFLEVKEIRATLEKMEKTSKRYPASDHIPTWGKLREKMAKHEAMAGPSN